MPLSHNVVSVYLTYICWCVYSLALKSDTHQVTNFFLQIETLLTLDIVIHIQKSTVFKVQDKLELNWKWTK